MFKNLVVLLTVVLLAACLWVPKQTKKNVHIGTLWLKRKQKHIFMCRDLVRVIRCRMRIRNDSFYTFPSAWVLLCLLLRNWRQWRQGHVLEHTDMQQCSRKGLSIVISIQRIISKQAVRFFFSVSHFVCWLLGVLPICIAPKNCSVSPTSDWEAVYRWGHTCKKYSCSVLFQMFISSSFFPQGFWLQTLKYKVDHEWSDWKLRNVLFLKISFLFNLHFTMIVSWDVFFLREGTSVTPCNNFWDNSYFVFKKHYNYTWIGGVLVVFYEKGN